MGDDFKFLDINGLLNPVSDGFLNQSAWGNVNQVGSPFQSTGLSQASPLGSIMDTSVMQPPQTGVGNGGGMPAFGDKGWVMPAIQGVSSLANIYFGAKNLSMAKDQFKFSSQLAKTNLANQAKLTNAQLLGAERSRLANQGRSGEEIKAKMSEYKEENAVSGQLT